MLTRSALRPAAVGFPRNVWHPHIDSYTYGGWGSTPDEGSSESCSKTIGSYEGRKSGGLHHTLRPKISVVSDTGGHPSSTAKAHQWQSDPSRTQSIVHLVSTKQHRLPTTAARFALYGQWEKLNYVSRTIATSNTGCEVDFLGKSLHSGTQSRANETRRITCRSKRQTTSARGDLPRRTRLNPRSPSIPTALDRALRRPMGTPDWIEITKSSDHRNISNCRPDTDTTHFRSPSILKTTNSRPLPRPKENPIRGRGETIAGVTDKPRLIGKADRVKIT